jgi:acyl carrier protein
MKQKIEILMADLFNLNSKDITDSLAMANTDGWDSLKHMELIVSIEETFGVELTIEEIVAMQTLKDIKKILKEKSID